MAIAHHHNCGEFWCDSFRPLPCRVFGAAFKVLPKEALANNWSSQARWKQSPLLPRMSPLKKAYLFVSEGLLDRSTLASNSVLFTKSWLALNSGGNSETQTRGRPGARQLPCDILHPAARFLLQGHSGQCLTRDGS